MSASQKDYDTGTAAATASLKAYIDQQVAAGKIPAFAEGMAEGFVSGAAAGCAKDVIDAIDAERGAPLQQGSST